MCRSMSASSGGEMGRESTTMMSPSPPAGILTGIWYRSGWCLSEVQADGGGTPPHPQPPRVGALREEVSERAVLVGLPRLGAHRPPPVDLPQHVPAMGGPHCRGVPHRQGRR
jgi:hypothetical protein